jgi:GH25 family lysozyme M1 (1,4-beta-N-acetylmuramidase)
MIGFDVSKWNAVAVPWREARFALVRASHGLGSDPMADEHLANARAEGVELLGTYHYLRGDSAGVYQAQHYWDRVCELGGGQSMALAVDLEDLPPPSAPWDRAVYRRCAADFLTRLRDLAGRPCAVYGSPGYLEALGLPSKLVGPLWVAHWGVSKPIIPKPWEDWALHQYEGTPLDRNRFRGSVDDWCRTFGVTLRPHPADLAAGMAGDAARRAAGGPPGAYQSEDEGPTIDMGNGGEDG